MQWPRSTDYAPLPTSTTSDPLNEFPPPARSSPFPPSPRQRWNKIYYLLIGCSTLIILSSLFVVPEETLPSSVSSAVGKSKEAFDAARINWGWQSQEALDEEIKELEEENGFEGLTQETKEETEPDVEVESDEGNSSKVDAPSQGTAEDIVDSLECSDEARTMLGDPSFWIVEQSHGSIYTISARNALPSNVPPACLSQAVVSARLVSSTHSLSPAPESETLYALPSPVLHDSLSFFEINLPSDLKIPKGEYELEVTLEFGFYPGVVEGTCGEEAKVCDELEISEEQGEQLKYLGEKIEVREESKIVEIGNVDLDETAPLCTDLSSLDGYWSSLTYYPTSPAPCSLFTPTSPTPFLPAATPAQKLPLWIHFVGDSNTRNMHSHLLNSFGSGHKISASKVIDSPTHNGTHASFATRWSTGEIPAGKDAVPDYILTWSWWYQSTPVPVEGGLTEEEQEVAWAKNLEENCDDLLRLVDTNLADYLEYANLASVTKKSPYIASIASNVRPHRTYLSLGSHSEGLSLPGSSSSLDYLLSEATGLSRSKRDSANLRLFTTTLVNPTFIPLDRFPHQDLVRNNPLIAAKNSYTRSRPEFADEGRLINIEALTRGITVDAEWMKPGRNGRSPDAVHFRDEVYEEWVRLVWTDLVQGAESEAVDEPEMIEERKRDWKRRIQEWNEEEEEQDDY